MAFGWPLDDSISSLVLGEESRNPKLQVARDNDALRQVAGRLALHGDELQRSCQENLEMIQVRVPRGHKPLAPMGKCVDQT